MTWKRMQGHPASAISGGVYRAPLQRFPMVYGLVILTALAVASTVAMDAVASTPTLTIHRRRDCILDQVWDTKFSSIASSSALFESTSNEALWTRVDACVDESTHCFRAANVDVTGGRLALSAAASTGGASVSVHKPLTHPQRTPSRVRVHAQFPHNAQSDATVSVSLRHLSATLVWTSGHNSTPRLTLRLASAGRNVSVVTPLPCPATAGKTHVIEFEWTPTNWLRWYWDSLLLHESTLATQPQSSTLHPSLTLDMSVTSTELKPVAVHVKRIELQQISDSQNASDPTTVHTNLTSSTVAPPCWPRVAAHDANCRRHHHFEPTLGDDQGYLSLDQVYDFLHKAPARFPVGLARVESIGHSIQNRSLLALCLGLCDRNHSVPQVLFTGMHHSREPISMMALVYTIDLLALDVANGDADMLALLFSRQLWFVPVVNPDGYARNEATTMWKTRRSGQRKNARPGCGRVDDVGVDLNRNYDVCFAQDEEGSSTNPCGEDYRGAAPFSEPETLAIKHFIEHNGSNFSVSLNYHSFGRYFNLPFACKELGTPTGVNLRIYEQWAQEMTRYNGFQYGQPWKDANLYSVNGETSDWLWQKHGIFAMSPEVGPAFETHVHEGFWPPREDVPMLAAELHYSNLVAARLGGPQYDVRVETVEREEAAEEEEGVDALLRLRVVVKNGGLRTAGDVQLWLGTGLPAEEERIFSTSAVVAERTLGTIQTSGANGAEVKLAVPQADVLHLVVRDKLSCQYIRLSVRSVEEAEGTKAELVQFQATSLPRCGFCRSIGRSKEKQKEEGEEEHPSCKAIDDLVRPERFVTRISNIADAEDRGAKPTAKPTAKPIATSVPSTAAVTEAPPPSTTEEPVDGPTSNEPGTPSTPSTPKASTSTSSNSSSVGSTASFLSVPILATLALAGAVVVVATARRRRRLAMLQGKGSQSYKVINQQLEEDEDEDLPSRIVGRRVASPRGRHGDSDDEDAEYGRRRSPVTEGMSV